MFKSLLTLPLLFAPLLLSNPSGQEVVNDFILESNSRGNYTIVDVNNTEKSELRIYYDESKVIDEVADGAFSNCLYLKTLMLSRSVTYITDLAFTDTITTLNYTGSETEYASLGLTKTFANLHYYACDEGFINYWNDVVRPDTEISICDMTKSDFQALYSLYTDLSLSERNKVDATLDKAGEKIGDSMKVLINQFKSSQPSQKTSEWKQSGALTFIIIVAVIGMTSICVFFLMKTKQIIS